MHLFVRIRCHRTLNSHHMLLALISVLGTIAWWSLCCCYCAITTDMPHWKTPSAIARISRSTILLEIDYIVIVCCAYSLSVFNVTSSTEAGLQCHVVLLLLYQNQNQSLTFTILRSGPQQLPHYLIIYVPFNSWLAANSHEGDFSTQGWTLIHKPREIAWFWRQTDTNWWCESTFANQV